MRSTFDDLANASRAGGAGPVPLIGARTSGALPGAVRPWPQVVLVSVALSAVAVVGTWFSPDLAGQAPYLLSFVAITAAGWFGGALGGVVATAATSAGVLFLVLPPVLGFSLSGAGHGFPFGAFVISALVVTWFNANRLSAAHRLAKSEHLSKIVVDSAPLLVAAADDRGNIVLFNEACEHVTGRNRDQVIGQPFVETLVPVTWRSTVAARFSPDAGIDLSQPHLNPWVTRSGEERFIEWRCYQIPVGAGRWTVGVGIDVTDRKLLEATLAAALQRERATSKQATNATLARERFITILAHELRNPLQAVVGWAGVIARTSSDDQVRTMAGSINKNARLMTRLIADVTDISRLQNGKVDLVAEPLDLLPLVVDEVTSFEPRAGNKNVRIVVAGPEQVTVNADADRLRQMLANLLSNALRFAPPHTTITVDIATAGDLAEVTVVDKGPGFSSEPAKLFEPFWQGEGHADGVGLGLALVAQLAEMHGGSARAASDPNGHGARVTFSIPIASSVAADRRA